MSGALLETAGQIRNGFPYIVRKVIAADLTLVDGTPAIVPLSRTFISETDDIPFDYGPDKSGRVYITINGISVILTATAYGAAGVIAGSIYFQDSGGIRYHLIALGDTLPNARAYNNSKILTLYTPIFSSKPDRLGSVVWENNNSVLSTLNSVNARVEFNIGYYGDYAEYDFDMLKKCEHHHYHGIKDDELVNMTKV